MGKTKQLTLKGVSDELNAKIVAAAEREGLRKSSWMRKVLQEATTRQPEAAAAQQLSESTLALLQEVRQGRAATMASLADIKSGMTDIIKLQHHFFASSLESKNKPPDH